MAEYGIPMTVAGVGFGQTTRWTYSIVGDMLSVYGINNHITMIFNLKSAEDIDRKLVLLRDLRDNGDITQDDLSELEERLRLYNSLTVGGDAPQSQAAISEGVRVAGETYTVYKDGHKVTRTARGKRLTISAAQEEALEKARKYAHTDEANRKRKRSIDARRTERVMTQFIKRYI